MLRDAHEALQPAKDEGNGARRPFRAVFVGPRDAPPTVGSDAPAPHEAALVDAEGRAYQPVD